MDLHVGCLYTHDDRGRVLKVNEPDNKSLDAARFFLGRTSEGNIWRCHSDVPVDLADELIALAKSEAPLKADGSGQPAHADEYVRLLKMSFDILNFSGGPVYGWSVAANSDIKFDERLVTVHGTNAGLLAEGFEELIPELPTWQPFVALVKNGRAVSVCRSARITSRAHEAGVVTLSDFRGRGFAGLVNRGWARQVQRLGAVPLYSTDVANTASQQVARKLGLEFIGSDFNVG